MNKSDKLTIHRLHPISILYFMVAAIKESLSFIWVFPLIVLFVHEKIGDQISTWIINVTAGSLIIFLLLVVAGLKWRAFTYQIQEKGIYIETGVFVTKKRWVTSDRIQSLDSTVRVYDHLFSTRTLTIELAGGKESSIILSCISKEEEQRIRKVLYGYNKDKLGKSGEESGLQLSNKDLIVHSLLSPKFGIVFTFLFLGLLKYWDITKGDDRDTLFTYLASWFGSNWIFTTVTLMILLSFALSLFLTYVSDYHFKLDKNERGEIEIQQGLFEKKHRTIAQNRIQAIFITERPLQRLLGYASIEAVVIQNSQDEQVKKTISLIPFVKKERAQSLIEVFTGYKRSDSLHTPSKKARISYVGPLFFIGCLLLIPLWIYIPDPYRYFSLITPILSLWLGWREYRTTGWNQSEHFLTLQYGVFFRNTAIIKRGRIQWIVLRQTWLQERKHLASINTAVTSGKEKVKVSLHHIPYEEAMHIYQCTLKKKEEA
ncbi:PH domain-containing protein [Priestia filamentosa]|uniref:PH domain-containing protein n=1 Tax=Priestia filamentosa TaxID=1402861 RepID=UPI001C1E3976|nr:PH domain-containing protein [Priestia filamentosa]